MAAKKRIGVDVKFAIIPEWVLTSDLSDRAVRLYGFLARRADNETSQAFPSRPTMRDWLDCKSLGTVDRLIKELEAAGAVTKAPRFDAAGDQTSNLYTVHRIPPGGSLTHEATPPDTSGHGGPTGEATGSPIHEALSETQVDLDPLIETRLAVPNTEAWLIAAAADFDGFLADHGIEDLGAGLYRMPSGARRDLLFDSVVYVAGWEGAMPENADGWVGKETARLRKIGASPLEVLHRARRYFQKYGERPTPGALTKHWAAMGGPAGSEIRVPARALERAVAAEMRETHRRVREAEEGTG